MPSSECFHCGACITQCLCYEPKPASDWVERAVEIVESRMVKCRTNREGFPEHEAHWSARIQELTIVRAALRKETE